MSLNFADLMKQAGPIEALPIGDYDVIVKTADATQTKDGSKPMIKCKLSIESGPHAGRTLYWNAVVSQENPNALRIFFVQMEALGLGSSFFAASPSIEAVAQNLVGKRARVNVGHRQYQGQTQPDIKSIKPAFGSAALGTSAPPPSTPPAPTPSPTPPAPAPTPPSSPAPTPTPTPQPTAETPAGVDIGEGTAEAPQPVAAAAGGTPPPVPF